MPSFDAKKQNFGVLVPGVAHRVMYINWKGEKRERCIVPIHMWYGSTEYHPEPQWLMQALDKEKQQIRDFAVKDLTPIIYEG